MVKKSMPKEDLEEKRARFAQVADSLENVPADKFLKDNFLPYAWSFILDRALTDVSGLKPVQRRILYTMYKDGLGPNSKRSKVVSIAGRVLASYHPHGDQSVADALKNVAREHVFRVPLIDGKGDFGVPGTPGADGRYIEARLSRAAWINVEEIGEHAVSMMPNYDGTTTEPVRLPVRWPVAVINGGAGMAVGYATKMPSHNPTEIMKACQLLLRNPDATAKDLQKIILGPDFNMGGTIMSNEGILQYLETGKGSFRIRGNYTIEVKPRGIHRIEFHEIPFGTSPEGIIKQINKCMNPTEKEVKSAKIRKEMTEFSSDISVYKDLSDLKHPIRVIIETKQGVNPKQVLAGLFRFTDLEVSFPANITTIVDNRPVQQPMRDALLGFISFRRECVWNKSRYNLEKLNKRKHLIDGMFAILVDIDKAISIIRNSDNTEVASDLLQSAFKIDKAQAEYVLGLQLRRLTKMDKLELKEEHAQLSEQIDYLTSLINDDNVMLDYLTKEFEDTAAIIGDERKTIVQNMSSEELLEAQKAAAAELKNVNKNLPCFVVRFANGTLLRTSTPFFYPRGSKKYVNGPVVEQLSTMTKDSIVLVGSDGMAHTMPVSFLPDETALPAAQINEVFGRVLLVAIAKTKFNKSDYGLALGTRNGEVKVVRPDYNAKDSFSMFTLSEGDEIIFGRWLTEPVDGSYFVSISNGSNILVYDAATVRPVGANAGGMKSQKLREGEHVVWFDWIAKNKLDSLVLSQSDRTIKMTALADIPPKGRGSQGVALHGFKKGETELVKAFVGKNLVASIGGSKGNAIPVPPITKRAGSGVDFGLTADFGTATQLDDIPDDAASPATETPAPATERPATTPPSQPAAESTVTTTPTATDVDTTVAPKPRTSGRTPTRTDIAGLF